MMAAKTMPLSTLSNDDLLRRLDILVRKEREITLKLLLHLNEMDRRRIYARLGYASLFEFCTRHLGYSESAANRRIQTARCVRDYPEVYDMLERNELNLTVVTKIAGIITAENKDQLLREVRSRSSRQVDAVVARYYPRSALRDRVQTVFLKTFAPERVSTAGCGGEGSRSGREEEPASGSPSNRPVSPLVASWVEFTTGAGGKLFTTGNGDRSAAPVLEKKYQLEFSVSPKVMAKIEQIKALLSSKFPQGVEFEQLFDIVLDEYLDRHSPERKQERREKREANEKAPGKTGQTGSRKTSPKTGRCDNSRHRHIPEAVQDAVYTRDNGRCSYISPDGTKCNSTWNLEIDHIKPFSRGGDHTVGNLRLLCARHNRLEAEQVYGIEFMKEKANNISRPLRE